MVQDCYSADGVNFSGSCEDECFASIKTWLSNQPGNVTIHRGKSVPILPSELIDFDLHDRMALAAINLFDDKSAFIQVENQYSLQEEFHAWLDSHVGNLRLYKVVDVEKVNYSWNGDTLQWEETQLNLSDSGAISGTVSSDR